MRRYTLPIASFFFGNGVAGVLAYFENTTSALVVSIISTSFGIALAGFYYFGKGGKKYSELSPIEMREEIKYRETYLPSVRDSVAKLINRIDTIANSDERLVNLDEYRKEYPIQGWHFKRIAKLDENTAFEGYLWAKNVLVSNLVLRKIIDNDKEFNDISINLDNLYSYVKDKGVRTFVKNIRRGLILAYSYVAFNRLSTNHFKGIPLKTKNEYEHARKAIERVRDLQNQLNERIKELLDGAQDEL